MSTKPLSEDEGRDSSQVEDGRPSFTEAAEDVLAQFGERGEQRWSGQSLYVSWTGAPESDRAAYWHSMNPADKRHWEDLAARLNEGATQADQLRKELDRRCVCRWSLDTTGEEGPQEECPYHDHRTATEANLAQTQADAAQLRERVREAVARLDAHLRAEPTERQSGVGANEARRILRSALTPQEQGEADG